jgi:hypothetical protein
VRGRHPARPDHHRPVRRKGRSPRFERRLRTIGDGPVIDLVDELESTGEKDRLVDREVDEAIAYLWPRLRKLAAT